MRRHAHYFKDVRHLAEIDVYRVLELFGVDNPAIAHAVKKLLLAGKRGRKAELGQTELRDVQEARDTLERWLEMRAEDSTAPHSSPTQPQGGPVAGLPPGSQG